MLCVSIAVTRSLGGSESGFFFLGLTIVNFLSTFARIGQEQTVLRFTADGSNSARSVHYKSILLSSFVSFFLTICVIVYSNWIGTNLFNKHSMGTILFFLSPSIIFMTLYTLAAYSMQGLRHSSAAIFTLSVCTSVLFIAGLLFLRPESAKTSAIIFSITSMITMCISLLYLYIKAPFLPNKPISWHKMIKSFLPLWVVSLMSESTLWSGQIISGLYLESNQIALLASAQRLAGVTSFILVSINFIVAPSFASMYRKNEYEKIRELSKKSVCWMLLFTFPIVLFFLILPKFMMSIFGEGFEEGKNILRILVVAQLINVLTGSVSLLLSMTGHEKDLKNCALVSGICAIIFSLVLIPFYGVIGAALATASAICIQNVMGVYCVNKRLGFNTLAIWRRL